MAGTFSDYASWRMPYDRDGTQLWQINSTNALVQRTTPDMIVLNNESNDSANYASTNQAGALVFIFPELRDLDGYTYIHGTSTQLAGVITVATSTDTTNGQDGTWTTLGSTFTPAYALVNPGYRTIYTAGTANGIKAVRFSHGQQASRYFEPSTIHLFGEIASGQNPNRLILWHPTLDQRVGPAYFDWGDVRRGQAAVDRTFRVKNNSSTLTANNVDVSLEVLTDAAPTLLVGQHSLSLDGSTFAQTRTIASIAPGAISGTVTLRRTISSSAALSIWALRVVAHATSWA